MNTTLTFGVMGLPYFGIAFPIEPPQKSAERVRSIVDHKLDVADEMSALATATRNLVDKIAEGDLREAQDGYSPLPVLATS